MPFLFPKKYRPRPDLKVITSEPVEPLSAPPARYSGRAWHESQTMREAGPGWVLATTLLLMAYERHDRCIITGEGDRQYQREIRHHRTEQVLADSRLAAEREAREREEQERYLEAQDPTHIP